MTNKQNQMKFIVNFSSSDKIVVFDVAIFDTMHDVKTTHGLHMLYATQYVYCIENCKLQFSRH